MMAPRRWVLPVIAVCAMAATVISDTTGERAEPPAAQRQEPEVVRAVPDAATAVLAARRQGSRVEVLDEATSTRTVFANPDGTHSAEITAVPTRAKRGDEWVPIDSTLELRKDGSVGPRAVAEDVSLSAGGSAAPLIRLATGPAELSIYWPGALPKPTLSGSEATYAEVLPGVDLVMRANSSGYQQLLVIKNPAAALYSVDLRVMTRGVRLSADDSGALRALNDAGEAVFVSPPSVMWDASGSEGSRSVPVGVKVGDGTLTLLPDKEFLTNPATKYPVTIDPTFASPNKGNWATVLSGYRNQPYWNTSGAGPSVAQVGRCYEDPNNPCNNIFNARAFFEFDTGFMWDKDLVEAGLRAPVVWSPDCSVRSHQLWVVHHGQRISPGTTWNAQPGFTQWGGNIGVGGAAARGCGGGSALGADVNRALNGTGFTTFMFKAAVEADDQNRGGEQEAWRKYDPAQVKLSLIWNRTPNGPDSLRTDPPMPAPCRWCNGTPYIGDQSIRFIARLSDPDNDMVGPRWRIQAQDRPLELRPPRDTDPPVTQISGATHDTSFSLAGLHDKWVGWWVHADDTIKGSGAVSGTTFVVDHKGISGEADPIVSSPTYRVDENAWFGGENVPAQFTFSPGKPCDAANTYGTCDIDHYRYGWTDGGPGSGTKIDAESLGGSATVWLAPPGDGRRVLHVQAFDRAGHWSDVTHYTFMVQPGTGPRSQWAFEGNTEDTSHYGDRHGTLRGNASYGVGAVGTAVQLDGSTDSYVSMPNTLHNGASYSVSAWVKPTVLSSGDVMGVVSQVGNRSSGWFLNYAGSKNQWSFMVADEDKDNPGLRLLDAPKTYQPQVGRWTHLVGVYDRQANKLRIYVDGERAAESPSLGAFNPKFIGTEVNVGRERYNGNYGGYWKGSIDEVKLYDRVLADAEIKALVSKDNVQTGYWNLNDPATIDEVPNSTARNAVEGGDAAVLQNGAMFTEQGIVGGSVRFNGQDGKAATSRAAVNTEQSFSVSAWVKPEVFPAKGQALTAVSQEGGLADGNSGFYLQLFEAAGKYHWGFTRFGDEVDYSKWISAVSSQNPTQPNIPTHLTGVYHAPTMTMSIYVDGVFGGSRTLKPSEGEKAWNATGPLVIGQARMKGIPAMHFWKGLVDEVHTYTRALGVEEIKAISSQTDVTAGTWKLDNNTNDSSGRNLTGTWHGSAAFTQGHSTTSDPADKAALLNGSNSITADRAVNTMDSYTVSAWVKPDVKEGCYCTVLSQDAVNFSGFSIHAGYEGKWGLFSSYGDPDKEPNPPGSWMMGGPDVQAGVWTHVVGVYNKQLRQLELYINGALIKVQPHTNTIDTPGKLQIGRALWRDARGSFPANYFRGAIDDVRVYNRSLFAEEIRAIAGRDLTLVHNWQLDESGVDSIGARGATLSGGASLVTGWAGKAVSLNGSSAVAATTGVDLRTDKAFTVSAWVHLDREPCPVGQRECKMTAVSLDDKQTGSQTSKFRLGHVINTNTAPGPRGKWIFEMPEQNGAITEAAVSVRQGELNSWVFLVGVYDPSLPNNQLQLFVYSPGQTPDSDSGTLMTPWHGTGGLQIGRARKAGNAVDFWQGMVDDVRLYTVNLDSERLSKLYSSYPGTT
jgi:hypothetical protein